MDVSIQFLYEAMVTAVRALRVLALWNTVNYSMVVDQSDYSISTILYNKGCYRTCSICVCAKRFSILPHIKLMVRLINHVIAQHHSMATKEFNYM